jgi:murein DD-endopeptidase MepM/ murein hydrolase activator NlpD
MVNRGQNEKPAVARAPSPRSRTGAGTFLRFRSPSVLVGGTTWRPGTGFGQGLGGAGLESGGDLLGRVLKSTLRLFPDRQILVRAEGRVSYIRLSRRLQLSSALTGLLALGALAYGLTTHHHQALHPGTQAIAPSAELRAQIDELQRQLAAANALLAKGSNAAAIAQNKAAVEEAQARIKALEDARDKAVADEADLRRQLGQAQDAASNRVQNMAQLNHTLDTNRGELRQSDAQRQALQARVHQLETELESANARTNQAKADLASNERRLQQLAAEHDQTVAERDRLQAVLRQLQSRSAIQANPSAAANSGAATVPPQRSSADRAPDQRSENLAPSGNNGEIEQVLASTGLDVEKLLGRLNSVPVGQGGPYIALDKRHMAESGARTEELQKILKTLPLAAPLAHYTVGSGFGGRSDPLNRRQAFHPGVDLEAPYRSPVYSTAPGVVIFTGVKDNYGKVVEIDHGHGIVTRYAHLHRYLVARGQKVPAHFEVGELGSTGRSTGPHLHYEVLVDGTAQDPEKFLQAGKNVVQANGN